MDENRETDRQTDRQTNRQTEMKRVKRTKGKNALGQDQEIERRWMRIERQTDRQTH